MHFGLVIANNNVGGIEHQMELLARGLMQAGEKVTVIYSDSPRRGLRRNRRKTLNYDGIPLLELCMRRGFRLFYRYYGRRAIRHRGIDLLIGNNPGNAAVALALAEGQNIPVATHISGMKFAREGNEETKELLRKCIGGSAVVLSNARVAIDTAKRLGLFDGKPERVIFNAVQRFLEPSQPQEGRFHVIFVGQLYSIKDPMTLILALVKAKEALPWLTATLVGDGELRGELQHYLEEHELTGYIRLSGFLPPAQIPYDRSDLFVNCSVSELSSGAIAEGLCHGMPAIGSAVGGTPEILAGHEFSAVFEPKDADELARKIICFGSKPLAERIRLGKLAREYGETHFSIATYVRQYQDLGKFMLGMKNA